MNEDQAATEDGVSAPLLTREKFVARLHALAGSDATLDMNTPLADLPIDSLELLELLYALMEEFDYDNILPVEAQTAGRFFDLSIIEVYQLIAGALNSNTHRGNSYGI